MCAFDFRPNIHIVCTISSRGTSEPNRRFSLHPLHDLTSQTGHVLCLSMSLVSTRLFWLFIDDRYSLDVAFWGLSSAQVVSSRDFSL
jgi:hypothetical protein